MPKPATNKREAQKKKLDKAILSAAEHVFMKKGFRAATTDEIAERASVTKRTLYKHFPSKLALFVRMTDVYLSKLRREMTKVAASDSVQKENIRDLYQALFKFTMRHQKFMRLFWIVDSEEFEGEMPKDLIEQVKGPTNEAFKQYAELIGRASDRGVVRPFDPLLVVNLFSAVNKGIFMHANKERQYEIANIKPEDLFELFMAILDGGLFMEPTKKAAKSNPAKKKV